MSQDVTTISLMHSEQYLPSSGIPLTSPEQSRWNHLLQPSHPTMSCHVSGLPQLKLISILMNDTPQVLSSLAGAGSCDVGNGVKSLFSVQLTRWFLISSWMYVSVAKLSPQILHDSHLLSPWHHICCHHPAVGLVPLLPEYFLLLLYLYTLGRFGIWCCDLADHWRSCQRAWLLHRCMQLPPSVHAQAQRRSAALLQIQLLQSL